MRIALNLLYMLPGVVGGTETYAGGLLEGFAQSNEDLDITVFVNRHAAEWPLPDGVRRVVVDVDANSRAARYAAEQLQLPGLVQKQNPDVLHSLGYVSPLRRICPSVVTVPDLTHIANPTPTLRRLTLSFFVKQSVKRCDAVIAISEFTRQELLRQWPIPPEKVYVTHLAPRTRPVSPVSDDEIRAFRDQWAVSKPYFVAFSSRFPHKNISLLIDAFSRIKDSTFLVLLGHYDPAWVQQAISAGVRERVIFTGYLDERTIQVAMAGAMFLAFPSRYEGFGLPVIEAQETGLPVVCSTHGSLPEVAGDSALYFDTNDIDGVANILQRAIRDEPLRDHLRAKGYENLRRFSWRKAATETLAVYDAAIRSSPVGRRTAT